MSEVMASQKSTMATTIVEGIKLRVSKVEGMLFYGPGFGALTCINQRVRNCRGHKVKGIKADFRFGMEHGSQDILKVEKYCDEDLV